MVNGCGLASLAGTQLNVGSELAGQRVTLRMDGAQMAVISHDDLLLRTPQLDAGVAALPSVELGIRCSRRDQEMASRVENAPTLVPECLILGAKQALTREAADG